MDIVLRGFQPEAVEALRANFRSGTVNQMLAAPTGSGKTVIGAHLLQEVQRKGKRALFICDRIPLIGQTSATLSSYGIRHGIIQSANTTRGWEKIQIASAQTLARRCWPDNLDLVIVDEAHTRYNTIWQRIEKRDVRTVGLSATPFTRGLATVYDAVVSVTTTNWLIENSFLSRYQIYAATQPDMTGARVNRRGEWEDEEAARRSMPIIGDCVAEYAKHAFGKKFICFGVNVAHCQEIQRQFMAGGIQCGLYTYQTPDAERAAMVEEFRKPDSYIRGLISVSALAKGFDVPDVECVICARPLRKSLAEWVQMFGRGLRSSPGKETCIVLDHSGNAGRFWHAMKEFFETGHVELDDGTRKPAKKPEAKERKPRKCPKCSCMHDPMPYCPACGFQYQSRSEIAHVAGTLSEVAGAVSREEKQRFYSELLFIARTRGRPDTWAGHRYREKFGVFPPRGTAEPAIATPDTLRWVQHCDIRFRKSNKFRPRVR